MARNLAGTEASCKATCGNQGGFNTGCGVYYCCAAKDWQCSGVKACGDLHDCACLTPNVTRPLARMLEETVSLYRGLTTADALDADSIRTTTEFVMLNKDRELVTRCAHQPSLQPAAFACVCKSSTMVCVQLCGVVTRDTDRTLPPQKKPAGTRPIWTRCNRVVTRLTPTTSPTCRFLRLTPTAR